MYNFAKLLLLNERNLGENAPDWLLVILVLLTVHYFNTTLLCPRTTWQTFRARNTFNTTLKLLGKVVWFSMCEHISESLPSVRGVVACDMPRAITAGSGTPVSEKNMSLTPDGTEGQPRCGLIMSVRLLQILRVGCHHTTHAFVSQLATW